MRLIVFCIALFIFPLTAQTQKKEVELTGDVVQIVLPSIAFASTLIWQNDDKPYWQFIKAFAVTEITTHSLKRIIDKERPNGGRYSFPSGHTSVAFTGAAFLQKRYGWEVGIPAYALAGFVGWSRVYTQWHDWWDVLAGAAIGTGSAYLFTKKYNIGKISISTGLYPQPNGVNLMVVGTF